jgi:hypothetical protein
MGTASLRLFLSIMRSEIDGNESDESVCDRAGFPRSENHKDPWYFAI